MSTTAVWCMWFATMIFLHPEGVPRSIAVFFVILAGISLVAAVLFDLYKGRRF